ncbi:LysR family transcriptional regulator [Saccharomonospora sp. NPDC006951]
MLDLPRLRLLRAVVATGSIRASATLLGYTPSAVSQQLASLQRETGLRLVEKAGRGIEPTSAGRTLAEETEPLFAALSHVEGVVDDLREGRTGSLSIGYFSSAGGAWLPEVVGALSTEFPELRLDLRMTDGTGEAHGEPDIDLLVEDPLARHADSVEVRHLIDDPYLAVVREDDPLATRSEIPLADLAPRRWIDNEVKAGRCRQVLLSACAQAGFSPCFSVEAYDYRTAISFVETGIGVTVIPELGIGELAKGLFAIPVVAPAPVRRVVVAVKKSMAGHPAARRTVELLEARVTVSGRASP